MLRNELTSVEVGVFDELPADQNRSRFDDIELKLEEFIDHVVLHPTLVDCEAVMETFHKSALHRHARSTMRGVANAMPTVLGPPRGMLITGLTGTGKSTISEHYQLRYPRYEAEEGTIVPVLRVELPSHPRTNVIAEQLLEQLGDPFASKGSGELRMERAKKLIRKCGVGLIIFDEIQHLTDNLDARTRDAAADTLKNLMSIGVPVVFIGLPTARSYFVKNQQLGRRCTPKVRLMPFSVAEVGSRKEFMTLLKSLHRLLPTVGASALIDLECVLPLHLASFGLLGQLKQLVEAALRIMLKQEDTALTREHLRVAFERTIFSGCAQQRNPFDAKFNGLPLTRPEEPYNGLVA